MSFHAIDHVSPKAGASEPDLLDDPALAAAYLVAGGLMEICGPLFWAVLVIGFLIAELPLV
jgi:hypothetical protein